MLNIFDLEASEEKEAFDYLFDISGAEITASETCVKFWQALRQLELENARMLNAKGELSEENAAAYEKLRKSYEHLFRNISS